MQSECCRRAGLRRHDHPYSLGTFPANTQEQGVCVLSGSGGPFRTETHSSG
ncbi:hypothetical protein LEMLEM_LOCUS10077 [Lemmus lemmus]